MEEMNFIANVNGVEVKYDILFTFDNVELARTYIAYTDHKLTDGKESIYMGYLDPYSDDFKVLPVASEEEKKMFDDVLNEIKTGSNYMVV